MLPNARLKECAGDGEWRTETMNQQALAVAEHPGRLWARTQLGLGGNIRNSESRINKQKTMDYMCPCTSWKASSEAEAFLSDSIVVSL